MSTGCLLCSPCKRSMRTRRGSLLAYRRESVVVPLAALALLGSTSPTMTATAFLPTSLIGSSTRAMLLPRWYNGAASVSAATRVASRRAAHST
ncbi:unnamed protein product, partial [Ectocarpus fasciculatus]